LNLDPLDMKSCTECDRNSASAVALGS